MTDAPDDDADLHPSPREQLEAEIAVTRRRVAENIDAIADRVSPSALESRLKFAAKQRVLALAGLVKSHPVPFVLGGLSAGALVWLALRPRRH